MNTSLPARITTPAPVKAGPQPRSGAGTQLTSNVQGFSYGLPDTGISFPHPFKPQLGLRGIRLTRGLLDTGGELREPTIKGVPIGGPRDGGAPPMLVLEHGVANEFGESWVCLEVFPDDKGEIASDSPVEIVHSGYPNSGDPKRGLCPLVMVVWRNSTPREAFEIVHFNLRYQRIVRPQAGVRHLFY